MTTLGVVTGRTRPEARTTRVAFVAAAQPTAAPSRPASRTAIPWTILGGRASRVWRNSVQSARSITRSSRMADLLPMDLPVARDGGDRESWGTRPVLGLGPPERPVPALPRHELPV